MRTVIFYSLPPLSTGFAGGLLSMFMLKYATDILLLAPAAIGLIFGLSRIWDGISDPLAGYLSDRTRTRFGRRRPWMLGSAIPLGVSCIAMWAPPHGLATPSLTLWLGAAILLYFTAQTCFNIPHKALGAELCLDHHGRTRAFAGSAIGDMLGSICSIVALIFVTQAADLRRTMWLASWTVAVVSVAAVLLAVVNLRERPEFQNRPLRNPFRAFGDVFRNPHARPLIFVYFLEYLGFNSLVSLLPYASEYVLHTPKLTYVYAGACLGTAVLSAPFVVPLARRFGKKRLWLASLVTKTAYFTLVFFLCREGTWPIVLVLTAIYGFAYAIGLVIGPSIKADVVDYDEYRSGERKEGSYFAAWSFAQKCGIAVALFLGGTGLSLIGFQPNVAQAPGALLGITVLFAGIPAIFHLLGAITVWRFRFDETEHARIRAGLDLRKADTPPPTPAGN